MMMMRLLASISAIALAAPTLAAPAQRTTPAPIPTVEASQPVFEFMGQTTDAPPTMSDLQGKPCTTNGAKYTCTSVSAPTVAGRPMRYLQIAFFNDRLYAVSGAFGEAAYQAVADAFTVKYGQPAKTEVRKWQSRAGAIFDNRVMIWNFSGDSTLELQSMGSKVDEGRFDFVSPKNAPPTAAPKVDF